MDRHIKIDVFQLSEWSITVVFSVDIDDMCFVIKWLVELGAASFYVVSR